MRKWSQKWSQNGWIFKRRKNKYKLYVGQASLHPFVFGGLVPTGSRSGIVRDQVHHDLDGGEGDQIKNIKKHIEIEEKLEDNLKHDMSLP